MAGAVDRDRAEPGRGAGGAHARSALVFRAGQTPPGVVDREPTASSLPCGGRSASPGNTGDCDPRARRHRARFSAVALIGRCAARAVSSRLSIDARCEVRRKGGERGVTGAGVSHGADAMARGAVSGVQLMPETIGTRQASLREATRHALREGYRGRRRVEHFVHREPVHRSEKVARLRVARDRVRVPGGRRRQPACRSPGRPRFPGRSRLGTCGGQAEQEALLDRLGDHE